MSDRRVSKEELEAFWRGDKNTYQRIYSNRMQQKANKAKEQGKQVTYIPNDGSAILPEVSVTAPKETEEQKQKRLKQDYENFTDNVITAAGFIPGLDISADIADIGNSWRKGDYSGMLWGLVGLGLPVSGKILKSGWNSLRNNYISYLVNKSSKNKFNESDLDKLIQNNYVDFQFNYGKNSGKVIHTDYGDNSPGFTKNTTGASIENNKLYPGHNPNTDTDYSWWNTDKPYAKSINNKMFNRFISVDETPEFINIRQQNKPIGQWDGSKGFVQKSERVAENPIDLTNANIIEYNPYTRFYNKILYSNPSINTRPKTADFSKAQSNIQLLDRMDEFANKYGYPLSDRSTILSNTKTNKQARQLIARHNTYLRGVRPGIADDVQKAKNALGKDNLSDLEFMQYAATHSRPSYKGVWISPEENAFIYGGAGNTAYVRRKYQLGKNRNKWFEEGGFEVQTNPINVNQSWDTAKGIIAPWDDYKQITKGSENELVSMEDLNFAGWANFDNWRHRVSLNNKVLNKNIPTYLYWKKGGKL